MVDAFDWSRTGAYAKVVEIISLLTNPITYTSFYKNILVALATIPWAGISQGARKLAQTPRGK